MEESVMSVTDYDRILQHFELTEKDYRTYPALTLAYIGDGVFDVVIRTVVILKSGKQVNDLHRQTSRIVKAETQAAMIQGLLDNELLTEEEKSIYKRGRNTRSHTVAKNASVADYRKATGFEAVMGYLYLTRQTERILELTTKGFAYAGIVFARD